MATPQPVVSDEGKPRNAFGINKEVPAIDPNLTLPIDEEVATFDSGDARGGEGEGGGDTRAAEVAAEREASRHGWVNQEEWNAQGKDPSRWRPAGEFLDVRNGIARIANEENSYLKAKLATIEQKLSAKETADAATSLEIKRKALLAERADARDQQDWDRFDRADQELLGLAVTQRAQPAKPAVDPAVAEAFQKFGQENQAWLNDPELKTDFMVELKAIVAADAAPDASTALMHAKRRVMRANPSKFGARPSRPAMFEMGGAPTGGGYNGGGRSWHDLRPEIRRQAETDIQKGMYSQKEFLANCDAEHFRR
jgi:hypothetical protein